MDKDCDGRIKCPAKDCCDNTFPDADALLVHLGKPIKQQNTTSPVSCMLCDFESYPSRDKKVMLAHLEKHFEATYPCQFDGCPWLGRTQDDANRHFNYAHKAMAKPKTKVQCDECVEVFASEGSLKPHKVKFHSTPTMAKCENCGSEVKEVNLKDHQRSGYMKRSALCPYPNCGHVVKSPHHIGLHMRTAYARADEIQAFADAAGISLEQEEEGAKKEERKQKEGKEETSVKVKLEPLD